MSTIGHMIFHHPQRPIVSDGISGSWVRPFRMLEAFKSLGYQVDVVAGNVRERKRLLEHIYEQYRQGKRYDFVYSESTSQPTTLTVKTKWTRRGLLNESVRDHLFLDMRFFRWCRQHQIPLGLFYRDIYWKFDVYYKITTARHRALSLPLYWYDWLIYLFLVDHLFLPSQAMKRVLPTSYPADRVSALPPGCLIPSITQQRLPCLSSGMLELFYVGGVKPPLYDLHPMLEVLQSLKHAHLIICCRQEEWEAVRTSYASFLETSAIHIVHEQGDALERYYRMADMMLLVRAAYPYLDFAMPVKVFESLGYGVPIVTTAGTAAADFIAQEDIGWVASSLEELPALLRHLQAYPHLLMEKRNQVEQIREQHTWKVRAQTVVHTLLNK